MYVYSTGNSVYSTHPYFGGRTFPSSPFSSPLSPFPPFRSPENRPHPLHSLRLEVGPVAARRSGGAYLGERISSPSGSSQNPAAKCILVHFMHIFAPLWLLNNENNFLFLLSIKMFPWCTCNSLLRQKKTFGAFLHWNMASGGWC